MRPLVRPGTVHRPALIERLTNGDACRVVAVVAPAGYGKTTLLSQWAERGGQAVAWVSVDEADNDPKVLLTYIAEALDAVEPVGERVFDALASAASSVPGSVVPRLGHAFSSMTSPVAVVLDDVHLLHNSECRAALSVLADHAPAGSRLVLSGRADPPIRLSRMRAEGTLLEIGPGDLSLSAGEAAALLRNAGLALDEDLVAELHRRTEGWPAGLYLAALGLKEGGSLGRTADSFGGDDKFVSDYVESEFLARISRRQRAFLTRTAVLERMCGPLCETVLDLPGSTATLAELARSNMLLVPLDRRREWYRYHHLFRDMLLAELHRLEPGLMPVLRRRAAGWCLRNALPEEALEYSIAAGDVDAAARLLGQLWLPADRWQRGDAASPDDPSAEAWAAVLRAIICRHGVEQMRAAADEAVSRFGADCVAAPAAAFLQGLARVLCGDLDGADASFEGAVSVGQPAAAPDVLAEALCVRSLVAMARGQWDRAEVLAGHAGAVLRRAGTEDAFVCAVQARAALHRGDVPAARQQLVSAQRARHVLTYAQPHVAVQARIELARVHLALADLAGARTLLREIDEVLRRRPGLGTLAAEAEELRAQLAEQRGPSPPGASALTDAELRLLPLLTTHRTFGELGEELFISRNTVKTEASSIYRKLGASTRSQAVARARELGLLEG